jgi:hypothetical protein
MGFGLVLAYAGVTGQHVGEELHAVFTRPTVPPPAPGIPGGVGGTPAQKSGAQP